MEFEIKDHNDFIILGVELCNDRLLKNISKKSLMDQDINLFSINRIEKGEIKGLNVFKKYIEALGYNLVIKLEERAEIKKEDI